MATGVYCLLITGRGGKRLESHGITEPEPCLWGGLLIKGLLCVGGGRGVVVQQSLTSDQRGIRCTVCKEQTLPKIAFHGLMGTPQTGVFIIIIMIIRLLEVFVLSVCVCLCVTANQDCKHSISSKIQNRGVFILCCTAIKTQTQEPARAVCRGKHKVFVTLENSL